MTNDLIEESHQANLGANESQNSVKNEDCCGQGCCDSDETCDNDDCVCCHDN